VAIVFDNALRPETTGTYCRRALGQLAELEHFLPADLEQIDPTAFDAFLFIDDGSFYPIPERLRPRAWWAIDTHLDFDRCQRRAAECDVVFAAQRDGAERLQQAGIAADWLPLACDPDLHRRHPVDYAFDWCFVGHVFPGVRAELLELLQQRFPRCFVGEQYFEAMAQTYSAARLVFNRSIRNDVNMRVFEALGCRSLLLTNDLTENGQAELLRDGVHCATYADAEELLDKAAFYLRHDELRERIATAGQAEVLARHTYRHRMEVLLHALEKARAQTTISVSTPIGKDLSYFEWDRPDVLSLVPTTARRVLDLGCASGRLGASIKRRQVCEVWGIERNSQAAEQARPRLDRVVVADLAVDDLPLPERSFDVVICADILEHLRDPQALLRKAREWLAPRGCLVASIPNAQHHSIVKGLLDGNFTYEPAGLLDEDHVRLFTRREIEKLFFRASFRVSELRIVPGPGWDEWAARGQAGEVRMGGLAISGLSPERAADFFAYQFLLRAEPEVRPSDSLTSIVLVTHNQIEYTRLCLDSLRFRTDEPFELVVVDNGSTDGTVDYLRAQPDVRLIMNGTNRGFPAAANQGIQAAQGEQILLLNNDTIVTTGWLRRLVDALRRDPQIGLVGPVSNRVSGLQQVPAGYDDLAGLDGFAWEWSQQHAGQVVDLNRLVGFCLMIRREVVDRIGLLDERFGLGNFEDDDYCRRARAVGYRTVVAVDAFIHHFGGRTFVGSGVDFASLMAENERKYREKWQDGGRDTETSAARYSETEGQERGLPSQSTKGVRLSLCMIVRDNEQTIRPCLESIRPWVDEMIVVDTGSTDATPRICEELGARVYHWAWRDDFSAARNESLKYARGEWIFWMDSDDTMPPECGQMLQAIADADHPPSILGFVMQVHCPGPGINGQHDLTVVDHVKLFRNRPDLRFEHRIHEQILPAIRRAGGDVQFTDVFVVHSGSDHSEEGRARKLERDFRLLRLDLQERPDHPFVLFNLGMTHADCGQHEEAVRWLTRCLEVSRPEESHVRKAYALLISVLYQQQRFEHAWAVCQRGRSYYPDDKELLFRQAMLEHQLGRLSDAVRTYRAILAEPAQRHFASVDAGLAGYKARHNLALVFEDQANFQAAESEWRTILAERPEYLAARSGLIECLLHQRRLKEAESELELLKVRSASPVELRRLRARIEELRMRP
jgi:GT2 family glycosyltransferase/2-polyprenyl-3-methyl-5-hydroxy-6-metoxy-1,4-benzoquinol methylase